MKMKALLFCMSLVIALFCASVGVAAEVAQGKCISYDTNKKIITMEEYDLKVTKEHKFGTPTGKKADYNVADAVIGITPKPGDILRIAYDEKGKGKIAHRVMNVTRTDIMKK